MSEDHEKRPHAVIVGGGVIGISTAIALLGHPVAPYDVTIVAPDLPSFDVRQYRPVPVEGLVAHESSFASAWAGAHHVSDAKTDVQRKRDRTTFDVLTKIEQAFHRQAWATKDKRPLVHVHQTEYYTKLSELDEECVSWYPNYRQLPPSALPDTIDFGATFTTLDLDVPKYLPLLFAYFCKLGGRAVQHRASSLADALDVVRRPSTQTLYLDAEQKKLVKGVVPFSFGAPRIVIASPGLGAKKLLNDEKVMPTRGQTVLVRAPWCTTANVFGSSTAETSGAEWCGIDKVVAAKGGYRDTYVIPRGDGTIICGGTRLDGDWDVEPRKETTIDILHRVVALMPQLRRPGVQTGDILEEVDIVDVNVGLRPNRQGGIRLERAPSENEVDGLPLIYNYGFGGIGYQSSWGAAFEARALVDKALQRPQAPDASTFAELDSGNIVFPDPSTLILTPAVAATL